MNWNGASRTAFIRPPKQQTAARAPAKNRRLEGKEVDATLAGMFSRLLFLFFALFISDCVYAAPAPDFSDFLHWRNIGPFRGGRSRAISGVPSQPNVFYMAQVNGGVFRTDDYGRTWQPIFDDQPTASVGALAVAISDPKIIYVGSGEGFIGPISPSATASTNRPMRAKPDASRLARWPANRADRGRSLQSRHLLVAVAGPLRPNEQRGVFLSTDGGKTFAKTLYKDENTGATM